MPSSSADARSPQATGLEFRPFRALTYHRRDPEHLARVSSPAYDLVTPSGRERLADADPHNIVRLILPRVEHDQGERGTAERSAELSAATLRAWLDDGVLDTDAEPALWLYELRPAGGEPATVGWLGAVGLPVPGSRAVLPHEDTYPIAVEGRRALLAATGTDLEPIVLAHDPDPEVARLTAAAQHGPPTLELQDADGVAHRLWRVTDPELLADLVGAFAGTGAVIADGHHRFAAAQAHARGNPGRPGADAILALVTPMGPGGLRVEAIHRVVADLSLDEAVRRTEKGFQLEDIPAEPTAEDAVRRWSADPAATGFLLTDGTRLVHVHDATPEVAASVPSEAPAAWRGLDVVLAHHGLFQRLWGLPDDPESVLITHDVPETLRLARERHGTGIVLRAPSPADVAAVARAGARMPRKSTLFVPKPRTGIVLRPHGS